MDQSALVTHTSVAMFIAGVDPFIVEQDPLDAGRDCLVLGTDYDNHTLSSSTSVP
jgi:hypothetical protein